MLQFRFVCSLFGLFCCSYTNNPRPCSTNTICGSHRLTPPAASQESMVALSFWPPALNCLSACTALSPSGPPNQSSLPSLPLKAIFEKTRQFLWSSTVFSSDYLPLKAIFEPTLQALWSSPVITQYIYCPSKQFLNQHAKLCDPVSYFYQITCPSKPFSNWHAEHC